MKQKHTKHSTIYRMIQNRTKTIRKNVINKRRISTKIHLIYISSNNDRHSVTKTFSPLQYISPNYTSLHFTTFVDTTLLPI